MIRILAVDPGGVTGLAVLELSELSPRRPLLDSITSLRTEQIPGAGLDDEHELDARRALVDYHLAELDAVLPGELAVVIEDFTLRKFSQGPELLTPVRVTASLEDALHHYQTPWTRQQPALAKSTATDARLRLWGLYDRSSGEHARDAVRHAITLARRARESRELRAQLWPNLPNIDEET